MRNPMEHKAIRRMALSERSPTKRNARERCFPSSTNVPAVGQTGVSERRLPPLAMPCFFAGETTIEFASHDPQRAGDYRPRL
jgi:gamma-glutamylcysteine synthetase